MAFAAPQSPVTPTDSAIPTATSGSASTEETVPILVRFKPGVLRSEVDAAIKATGGASMREHAQLGLRVVEVPAAAQEAVLTAYARHPLVRSAEPAHRVTAAGSPNDPLYAQQWALPKISWDKAYGVIPILGSAKIAVLDTGIDATQPDLIGRLSLGTSFVGGVATTDLNGHGTEVAGIAAANVNNLVGMAGVAFSGASVVPVQVLHTDGTGWDSDVVSGVLWAADNGAQVILMSFSSTAFSSALQDAVNYAWSKGAIVIAAAGNQGSTAASYPAGMANVIGVAATDANDAVTAISNTGSAAVAAPGVDIYATAPAASYVKISGTSPAAAETAGLAALLIASGKSNSAASAQIRGATDPIAGRSFGRINVAKALGAPVTPPPTPAPTATPPPGPTPTYTIGAVNFMRLRQVNATGQENYIYTSGDVIYPDANVTPAGTHYKVVVTDAAGTPHGSFSCGTAPFTGASNTYTVQSTDPVSNASDWTFTINQYSATDTTCTGTITNTDHLAFDVAKATAYTDSSLSTTATQYSSGDTAYVVIQGVQQSQTDYSTIWIPTGFTDLTATCHNTTGSDQPDTSSVGRLPSPAGSFLQYPPGASGDPWNLLANYDSTGQACPLTTPGQWQIKVQKNSTHFVTLNAFTVVAAARGTLVVTKNTVGGNGVFTFTTSDGPGGPPATFSITTTGPLTAGVGSATFAVNAGTYTITEQVPADFVLSGAGCPAPIGMSPTVTVAVASGGTSSCSYSDTKRATLTVTKNTQGGNGTFTFNTNGGTGSGLPATFTISTTGNVTTGAGATTFTVAPGTYAITEIVPSSFVLLSASCSPGTSGTSATVTVAIPMGTTSGSCAFSDAASGSVVVTKSAQGGDGSFTFTLTGGPQSVTMSATINTILGTGTTTFSALAVGSYDVSETVPSSFYAVGPTTCPAVVSGGSPPPTCSFTDKKRGQILITKNTYGGDGSFTFTLTGGPENVSQTATITTTAFVGTTSFTGLAPGLYSVSESVPGSFYPAGATQCSATVESGGTTMCTFTNDLRGSVVVTKNTVGGNGSFTFTLTGGPETVSATVTLSTSGPTTAGTGTATFSGLAPGSYAVTEGANADFVPVANVTTCSAMVVAGQAFVCPFANNARGSIVVTKNTVGGTGSFTFTLTGGPESVSATATISTSGTTMSASGTATFGGLTPGATYTVSEGANASFTPSGFTTCVAVIPAGGSFPCSFTNNANGSVVVTKNTTGGQGVFTFTLSGGPNSASAAATITTVGGTGTATFSNLPPSPTASYTVSEAANASFSAMGPTSCAVTVSAGAPSGCSFSNVALGSVVVTKNTVGGNGSFTFVLSNSVTMSATVTTTNNTGSTTFSALAPGTFTLSEIVDSGFVFASATCSAGVLPPPPPPLGPSGSGPITLTVSAGMQTDCSFTNNARGQIVVTKNTTGGNGSFTFTLTGGPETVSATGSISTSNGTGTFTFSNLAPSPTASYTVSEAANASFSAVGPTSCVTTVSPGASSGCSFSNVALGSIVVTKNTVGGNGSFTFTLRSGTMTATATISTVAGSGTVTFSGVAPGTFTVSEGVNASFAPMGSTTCSVNVPPGGTATCSFTNVKKNEGFMTGGGQIKTDDKSEANFGGNARGTAGVPSTAKGHFNYLDHDRLHLDGKVTAILAVDPSQQEMWFCFTDDKSGNQYTVRWRDVDEPNQGKDKLGLWSGCELTPTPPIQATNNPVDKGNVQWHPPH